MGNINFKLLKSLYRSLYLLLGALQEYDVWKSHIEEVAFTNNNILSGKNGLKS